MRNLGGTTESQLRPKAGRGFFHVNSSAMQKSLTAALIDNQTIPKE